MDEHKGLMHLKNKLNEIFIIHFEPLEERIKILINSLKIIDIPISIIAMNKQIDDFNHKNYDTFVSANSKKMSAQELSVSLAHLSAWKKIKEKNHGISLILEDDALINSEFFEKIEKAIDETIQGKYDFSFLSSGCNLHVAKNTDAILHESQTSRTVCGYLVSSSKLNEVINACEPIQFVIDWQLNHIKNKLNLKFAWAEPEIIIQGSEGFFQSSLEPIRRKRQ